MDQSLFSEMAELESKHWWFVARRAYLYRLIEKYLAIDSQQKLCEIGCGTGGNLKMLSEFGSVDGVEINESAKKIAESLKTKNETNIFQGHLPDAIPLKGFYDGVFSLDVIEHIENDLEAVKALKELANENGRFIFTVPAYQWLWSWHDEVNHHYRRYTKKSFCDLLEQAGLNVRYASYFNTLLFPLAVVKRITEFLVPKRLRNQNWDVQMPSSWLNKLLESIFKLECYWAGKLSIPFGLSIVVVAEKQG